MAATFCKLCSMHEVLEKVLEMVSGPVWKPSIGGTIDSQTCLQGEGEGPNFSVVGGGVVMFCLFVCFGCL